MGRLLMMLKTAGSRAIVIAENDESTGTYLRQGFRGWCSATKSASALVECVRRVARGDTWVRRNGHRRGARWRHGGTRVRDRLTPKEISIVALIVQGCRTREIGLRREDDGAGNQELSALHL